MLSAVNCQIVLTVSDLLDIEQDGSRQLVATAPGDVLAVSNDRGSPGNPVYVSGATSVGAATVNQMVPVAVGGVAVALVAANAARRSLRIRNDGPGDMAIGPAGQTWANRAVVIVANETWVETDAPNIAWSAVADGVTATTARVQEVMA